MVIPDAQVTPGVPIDHMDWAGQAIVDYKPDVITVLGDWWDMHSLNSYDKPGSKGMVGASVEADVEIGNEAFARLVRPMDVEMGRLRTGKRKLWEPECHFLYGNHEQRIQRFCNEDPRFAGIVGYDLLKAGTFHRHDFLEIVTIDGIWYSHYFANTHSGKAIGGSIDNRLNRIGNSFVQGHQQGLLYGIRQYPGSLTRHGIVAGSFYQHDEDYRGAQGNGEWRGIVVLNEVENGSYDVMPLSMDYLRRKYG